MNALEIDKVYIIQSLDSGYVKIGYSHDVHGRVRSLENASGTALVVLRMIDGGRPVEKWMHKRFSHLRRRIGEWFDFHADMLSVVPPDVVPRVAKYVSRRDVKLTIKERLNGLEAQGDEIGLSATQVLMMLVSGMTEAEAKLSIQAVRGLQW